jgi:Polysaccharide pyruvyl transferase
MKRVAIIGNDGRAHYEFHQSIQERFRRSGRNTGNNMFWYAVSNQISAPKDYYGWSADTKRINATADCLVIVAANWIFEKGDLSALANVLERVTVPVVVVGLGVQAPNAERQLDLKPGTLRFVDLLREKKIDVCVRGESTGEWLKERGLENVHVTGCPSNFINPTLNLGEVIEAKFNRNVSNVVISVAASPAHAAANSKLAQLVADRNWLCIVQDPIDVLDVIAGNLDNAAGLERLRQSMLPMPSDEADVGTWVLNHYQAFYDAEAWMDGLKRYDLQIGTKLHGSMACFQAAVPSIFVTHDLRTKELAASMGVPSVSRGDMLKSASVEELVEKAAFDGAEYDTNRKYRAGIYADVLAKHNIPMSQALTNLAAHSKEPVAA